MKPKKIKAEDGVSGANVGDIIDYGNGVYRRVSDVTKWEKSGRLEFRRVLTEPCDKDGNVPFAPHVGMLVERKHNDGRIEVVRITKVIPVTIGGFRGWKWIGKVVSKTK